MSVTAHCPHCGKPIALTAVGTGPLMSRLRGKTTTLESTAPSALGAAPASLGGGANWERVTPVGRLEPKDVTTALYDAGVSFGLITLPSIGLCYSLNWPLWVAPGAGATAALWRYFGGMRLAQGLLEIVETITNTDINRDGITGQPAPENKPMRFEVTVKNEAGLFLRMFRFDLPKEITPALFNKWAAGVLLRDDLTQERWVNNDDFVRVPYTKLLDKLEEAQIVYRASPARNAPYKLTRHGKNVLKLYLQAASDTHSHSLTQGGDDFTPEYQERAGDGRI